MTTDTVATIPDATSLRARRTALGLSVVKFAIAAGYSPAYISAMEAGYRPRTDALAHVERVLTDLETSNADAENVGAAKTRGAARGHVAR